MSRIESLLETAHFLDDPSITDIEYGIGARVVQPRLAKALQAVLDRHTPSFPMPKGGVRVCIECSESQTFDLVLYPCPTIVDLEEAMR